MNKSLAKTIDQALTALRRPGAKLLRQYGGRDAGFYVCIPHGSFRVGNDVATKLLERDDVRPHDSGLLPGHPQSWKLGGTQ
jgi:hypothetical protein